MTMNFRSITLGGLVASLLVAILFSAQTFAWAEISPPAYTFDIAAKTDEQTVGEYASYANWREKNYAVFEYSTGGDPNSPSGTVIMAVWNDNETPLMDYGTPDITYVSSSFLCRWNMDGNYLYGCQNGGGGMPAKNLFAVHLTQAHIDLQDPQTWTPPEGYLGGGGSNPLDPDNDHTPQCQPWDVGCWFSGVIGNVVDGFQGLADTIVGAFTALGDWIANLIMPSNGEGGFDNRFIDFFTTVQDTMTERLGFLLFPFQFIADLVASFTTIYNPYGVDTGCTSGSQFAIPNLLGNNGITLDLCKIEDTPVWEPASILLRFVWIVGLVGLLQRKYMSTVRA